MIPFRPNTMGLDRALAAMFCRARKGETISLMAAESQQRGEKWGCRVCKLLDVVVQKDHCAWTLASTGELTGLPAVRAAGALIGVVLAVEAAWTALVWFVARWTA